MGGGVKWSVMKNDEVEGGVPDRDVTANFDFSCQILIVIFIRFDKFETKFNLRQIHENRAHFYSCTYLNSKS